MAAGELKRFAEKLKAQSLLDESGRAYRESGLGYMRLGDDELFDRLLRDQRLLRMPLVRFGQNLSAGHDETAWKRCVAEVSAA